MQYNVKILMEDCVFVKDKIYFFSKDWNGLYVTSIKTKETKLIGAMPEEAILSKRLCAGIIYYCGKLILIPMAALKIWIYDLENNNWKGIKRKYIKKGTCCNEIFRAVEYKEYLFFIGCNYPAIIRMNMETYELVYIRNVYDLLLKENKVDCYFRCDFFQKENKLLLASCLNNYVLDFNLDTLDFKWMKVGEKDFRYSGITWDGEFYWLSPRMGTPIVKWDGKNKVEYFPLPQYFKNINNFLGVQCINGKLIFPGMHQKETIIIDSSNTKILEVKKGQYWFYRFSKENIVLSQTIDGLLQIKDLEHNECHDIYCKLKKEDWIKYIKNNGNESEKQELENTTLLETSMVSLFVFVLTLYKNKICKDESKRIGTEIWNLLQK